jgi:hypothetical protein
VHAAGTAGEGAAPRSPAPRSPARRALGAFAWLALAVALGLGSAAAALWVAGARAPARDGWIFDERIGTAQAGPYARALVALGALLALGRDETMYWLAREDATGAPLRSRCRYRIAGPVPGARWWSVAAYADDHFLFANEAGRHAFGADAAEGGRFEVVTGPEAPDPALRAWLPTPGDRGLVLVLRLYVPADAVARDPRSLALPRVEPIGACR